MLHYIMTTITLAPLTPVIILLAIGLSLFGVGIGLMFHRDGDSAARTSTPLIVSTTTLFLAISCFLAYGMTLIGL